MAESVANQFPFGALVGLWFPKDKSVANSRPLVFKMEGRLRAQPFGARDVTAWFFWHARAYRVTVTVLPGEDAKPKLADALEAEYVRALGTDQS